MRKKRLFSWAPLAAAAGWLFAFAPQVRAEGSAASVPAKAAAAVAPSTAPLLIGESYPFALELSQGNRGSQVRLLYSLRWGGGDLGGLGPGFVRRLVNPFETARWIGKSLRRNQIYRVYGVRIRPDDLFVEEAGEPAPTGPAGPSAAAPSEPRRKLSLGPFLADLKNDLKREGFIQSMDLALPKTRSLDFQTKRAMAQGLLLVDRQQDIPLFGLPTRGVEFFIGSSTAAALSPKYGYRLPQARN